MMQQALRTRRTFALVPAVVLTAAALLATATPLLAQTSDVWTNSKISDLRRHNNAIPSEAAEHYEIAQRYLVTIDRLTKEDELSKRQQKKLDRSFKKATHELGVTVEKAPDWVEARMALAALHYKQKDYPAAREQYQAVLRYEPDNERAKSFLGTVEYYISHQEMDSQDDGDASGRPPWEESGDGQGSGGR